MVHTKQAIDPVDHRQTRTDNDDPPLRTYRTGSSLSKIVVYSGSKEVVRKGKLILEITLSATVCPPDRPW